MAVITNKIEAMAQKILDFYFPEKPFTAIRGERKGVALKPRPQAGLELCKELYIPHDGVVYLGDGGSDMDFARNCGFHAVGVTWGYRDRAELEAHYAESIIDDPEALINLLELMDLM